MTSSPPEPEEFEWVASGEVLRERPPPAGRPDRGPPSDGPGLRPGPFGPRFHILGLLGRGGMGAVYRARDLESGQEVALKVLLRGDGNDGQRALRRFEREGRLTANLRHPGIVGVHAAGEEQGRAWIAFELVEGARSLDEAVRGRPLPERVRLVRDAARALGHAHAGGVIHRDVKPENLLVDAAGRVRVTDFGLGRGGEEVQRLTHSGALLGTPLFMSPEQLGGQELDARADVWALGVVLYRAVTGEHPFSGESLPELSMQIGRGTWRPMRELVQGLDPRLDDVVARALAPLSRRYPDAGALAADLEAWLRGERPSASGPGLARPARAAGGALLLAGLALGLGGVWLAARREDPEPALAATSPLDPVAPTAPAAVASARPPAWWERVPARRRPPLPLPAGLSWGLAEGSFENARDGSRLAWIPPADEVGGFFLGIHEVTWRQWRVYCAAAGLTPEPARHADGAPEVGDDHPVFRVTLGMARDYCRWAGLRLPSEREWLAAARPGGAPFPWGRDRDPTRANLTGPTDPWPQTSPVGQFPRGASPEGVHDLVGNVWECLEA